MMSYYNLLLNLNLFLLILTPKFLQSARLPCRLTGSCSVNHAQGEEGNTKWAVLVAGSNQYYNYRHQGYADFVSLEVTGENLGFVEFNADICHAYQILKRGGLKDEHIIVFMYDDIANNKDNPRPGIIINKPKGRDVYAGVPKDYTGNTVTAANLYAVLLGDKDSVKGGSGKVVNSKPNDRIFVYYSDHGGPRTIGMPNKPNVYAKDLIDVLEKKHAVGTYKEMVIYVEACESGSLFEGLLKENMSIYVMTAANAVEKSWGTYCPGMKPPPPPEYDTYDTCLGDLFSISWMEDSDKEDTGKETLEQQYKKVKVRTYDHNSSEGSHVMEYGTTHMRTESLYLYQGLSASTAYDDTLINDASMGVVNQRDADLLFFERKYEKMIEGSQEKSEMLKQINDIKNHRAHLDSSMHDIGERLFGTRNGFIILNSLRAQGKPIVDDWECLKSMVRVYEKHCGSLTEYGMKHMRAFANICNNNITEANMELASIDICGEYDAGMWSPLKKGYSA